MSDFGTMLMVKRRDGKGMEDADRARLEQAIRPVQATEPPQTVTGEPFRFKVVGCYRAGGGSNLGVILSEYWQEGIEEGGYDLSVDEILEADRPKVQAVEERLAAELGAGYDFEKISGSW